MLVRVDPTIRARLERDAKRAGRSLSSEAELALSDAFRAAEEPAAETRALCYLIKQVVEAARNQERTADPEFSWRENRFDFEAFRYAVIEVLDRLAPAGEVDGPSRYRRTRSAEDFGLLLAAIVLTHLTADTKRMIEVANRSGLPRGHHFYAFPQAARDLRLKNANQERGK